MIHFNGTIGALDDQTSYTIIDRQLKIEVEVLRKFKDGRGTQARKASVKMTLTGGSTNLLEGSIGIPPVEDNDAPHWDDIANDDHHWTSTKLQKQSIVKHMKVIWDTYFGADAKYEICIDSKMRFKTVFRISHVNEYGPEVFEEATIDPLKTMRKDVLPRFLVSPYYRDLKIRLKIIAQLPLAESFSIDPPLDSDLPHIGKGTVKPPFLPILLLFSLISIIPFHHDSLTSIMTIQHPLFIKHCRPDDGGISTRASHQCYHRRCCPLPSIQIISRLNFLHGNVAMCEIHCVL